MTEAKRQANQRYLATKKTINLRLDPAHHARVQEKAAQSGMSVQAFILAAIREKIEREENT